jgi:hypothetical protein
MKEVWVLFGFSWVKLISPIKVINPGTLRKNFGKD